MTCLASFGVFHVVSVRILGKWGNGIVRSAGQIRHGGWRVMYTDGAVVRFSAQATSSRNPNSGDPFW